MRDTSEDLNAKNRAAVRFTYSFHFWVFFGVTLPYPKLTWAYKFGVAKICPTMNSTLLQECERDGRLAELLPTLVHLHGSFQGCEMCDLMDVFSEKIGF